MEIKLENKTVLYIIIAIILVTLWGDLKEVASSFIKAANEPEQIQQPQMFMVPTPRLPSSNHSPNNYAGNE